MKKQVRQEHPKCKNKAYDHVTWYGSSYGGYCLECSNAGVDILDDKILELKERIKNLEATIAKAQVK